MSSSKYLNKGHLKQRQISEAKIRGDRILGVMPDVLRRHRFSSEVVKRTMLRYKPSSGAKNGDTEIDQKNARRSKCLKLAFSSGKKGTVGPNKSVAAEYVCFHEK
ncbi:hypothetical protein NPIL_48411 [Nephila pilipes]|uniref:Uncharacterized protein n=1 Tax=Nephila pilipes TaxID=299642 RepID=A0A8X6PHV2_NEPPI|nr:hypothetical protein NPIL_48411 [Nephila pilipes]